MNCCFLKETPTQVSFYEMLEIFENSCFEKHIFFQIRVSRFNYISRFKSETCKNQALYDNMYIKSFTFLKSHFIFPISYQVQKLKKFVFSYIFN